MTETKTKKIFLLTHGCQMNSYDSTRMMEILAPLGYVETHEAMDADLLLLNSCHIREKASEKLFSELGRWRDIRVERIEQGLPRCLIAVAGCVAQAEGHEILRRAPFVDIVLGPQSYPQLAAMVTACERGSRALLNTDFPFEPKFDALPQSRQLVSNRSPISAFLAIQEGCDQFCSFCVVPFTRGAEYSRPTADIMREAEQLVAQGARDITLLGQNVNAWHGLDAQQKRSSLGKLLRELATIDDLLRLRYTTSHPSDVDDDLIYAHRDIAKVMPLLHLPVQSGSDSVLAAMNRRHSISDYLRTIDRLREAQPSIAFSSDFIVGFPGESDQDFAATLKLVERVGFAQSYSFKYSPRPGTKAAEMTNTIPDLVQNQRLQELQALIQSQQDRFNDQMIGSRVPVIFEKPGRHSGQIIGRTPWLQPVVVETSEDSDTRIEMGKEYCVQLMHRKNYSFGGLVIDSESQSYTPTQNKNGIFMPMNQSKVDCH